MELQSQRGHAYSSTTIEGQANAHFGDRYVNQVENHSSTVNHIYHQQPLAASPASRPRPSIVVPYPRNRDFVVRDEFLTIWNRRNDLGARIALIGLGGIGKSQLAIEFTHRLHKEKPDLWVFWVHASSTVRFEESYKTIAESMQIPGRHERQVDIFTLVRTWLSQRYHGEWVMVVDNADDELLVLGTKRDASKHEIEMKPLSRHLPSVDHGLILLTTRNWSVAHGLVGRDPDMIALGPMKNNTAIELLEKKLGEANSRCTLQDLTKLAELLDYMPLAMTQAVAYIRHRAPRMSVSKYIETLQQGDEVRSRLLETEMRDPWRDGESSNSIIKTWACSIAHIRERQPSATRLLSLMSQFDREAIPEDLLEGRYEAKNADAESDQAPFDDDIGMLRNFNLISINAAADSFDMHRIVQWATRKWLVMENEMDWWQQRFIEIIEERFPVGEYVDWPFCQALLPHVLAMEINDATEQHVAEVYATTCLRASSYASLRGLFDQAEVLARWCFNARERSLGPKNLQTLQAANEIGTALEFKGKYAEAEVMHRQALAGCEEILGKDHLETLTCANGLGLSLQYQGKFEEAEAMQRRAVAGFTEQLGPEDLRTSVCENDLALTLRKLGNYTEAEMLYRRGVDLSERKWGKDHPETLTSITGLALVLEVQKKYEEAEALYRRALKGSEQQLGRDNPATLTRLSNLGILLRQIHRYDEAETLARRSYVGHEQQLGKNHPSTARVLWCLADILAAKGALVEAHDACARALAGLEATLGKHHSRSTRCRRLLDRIKYDMRISGSTPPATPDSIQRKRKRDNTAG